jgi:hypothetical protein
VGVPVMQLYRIDSAATVMERSVDLLHRLLVFVRVHRSITVAAQNAIPSTS